MVISPARSLYRSGLRRSVGFTLVELMVTLVVLAILIGIAAPSFRVFLAQQRIRATSMDLRMGLTMARSEAVKRNERVALDPLGGNWSEGWQVALDPNVPSDPNAAVVLYRAPTDITVDSGSSGSVVFRPNGRPAESVDSMEVSADGVAGAKASCLSVSAGGQISSKECD